jgi:hypothetical protein
MAGQPFSKQQQLGAERKRYRRVVASRKSWEKLRDERLGPCLICRYQGTQQEYGSSLHHVVPRGSYRGGDDVAANLVPLCGDGSRGHHGLIESGDTTTRRQLAEAVQKLEPDVYAYAIDKLGEDGWLRQHRVEFRAAS